MKVEYSVPSETMFIGFLRALELESGYVMEWTPDDAQVICVGHDMRQLYLGNVDTFTISDYVGVDNDAVMRAKWEGFTGRVYDGGMGDIQLKDIDQRDVDAALMLEPITAITYLAPRDMGEGEWTTFTHQFAQSDRPVMMLAADGGDVYILGGRYRFTTAGIVDDSDIHHAHVP